MSFKGKKNVYTCELGHQVVTVDDDEGVTPFMTMCAVPGCGHWAQSSMYRVDQSLEPHLHWFRPPKADWFRYSPATIEHLKRGGLIRSDVKLPNRPAGTDTSGGADG